MTAGHDEILRAADALAARVPQPLGSLARLAFNYRWSWTPDGPDLFASIDHVRWERCGENPVRLLGEVERETLERAAGDAAAPDRVLLRRVRRPSLAADLLRRARCARRRHPQGVVRPRAPARRDRAH